MKQIIRFSHCNWLSALRWTRSLPPKLPPHSAKQVESPEAYCAVIGMLASRKVSSRLTLHQARRWAHTAQSKLNSVNADDIAHFSRFLPHTSVLSTLPPVSTASSELSPFNNDWMNKYHGKSTTVLRPRTTEEVSKIVKHCNERGIGIVPQGGNTGLVGGGVPIHDELILSLGNMNKVRSFDPVSGLSFRLSFSLRRTEANTRYSRSGCWLHSRITLRIPRTASSHCSTRPWRKGQVGTRARDTKNENLHTYAVVVKLEAMSRPTLAA